MKPSLHSIPKSTLILIGVLVLIFLISIFFFVQSIRTVRHTGLHPHNPINIVHTVSGEQIQRLTIADVDKIDVWMNFSYIDIAFGLPPDLLEKSLGISSPKYPGISLRGYIKAQKLDSQIFVQSVRDTVRTYLSGSTQR